MPETKAPRDLSSYIDTGIIDRVVENSGGSTLSGVIKTIPAIIGGFVGATIGWVTGSFLGKWVAGWFSDKLTEKELRDYLNKAQVIPAFQDIVNFDNLKATENESRGGLSILHKVYGEQCVSTVQPSTHLNIANFIKSYLSDDVAEVVRLSNSANDIGSWWESESRRLIAEGNTGRESWFSMYNACVSRKLEILWSRIEEVLGENVENPETLEEILEERQKKFEIAGMELSPTALLVACAVLFLIFTKST